MLEPKCLTVWTACLALLLSGCSESAAEGPDGGLGGVSADAGLGGIGGSAGRGVGGGGRAGDGGSSGMGGAGLEIRDLSNFEMFRFSQSDVLFSCQFCEFPRSARITRESSGAYVLEADKIVPLEDAPHCPIFEPTSCGDCYEVVPVGPLALSPTDVQALLDEFSEVEVVNDGSCEGVADPCVQFILSWDGLTLPDRTCGVPRITLENAARIAELLGTIAGCVSPE